MKGDEVGIDVLVLLRHQSSGEAARDRGHHKGHHLDPIDTNAHGCGGNLVGLHRHEGTAKTAAQQVAQQQVGDGRHHDAEPHPLHHGERRTVPGQRAYAVQALRTAEDIGPLRNQLLDHDAEGQGDHRQVGTFDPQ